MIEWMILFQGYNRVIAFSRPFYFCLCACLILALDHASGTWLKTTFTLYTVPISTVEAFDAAKRILISE